MQKDLRYNEVAPQRYREKIGLFYEEFTVGDIIEHRPGRTVLDSDNTWLTLLGMNPHPVHFDTEYAKHTEFDKPLVNSLVTFMIINGMTVRSTSGKAIANLGWDKVRLKHPVFAGDTLYAETKVLSKRLSKSREGQGLVTVKSRGLNQNGVEFMEFERTFMVPCEQNGSAVIPNY